MVTLKKALEGLWRFGALLDKIIQLITGAGLVATFWGIVDGWPHKVLLPIIGATALAFILTACLLIYSSTKSAWVRTVWYSGLMIACGFGVFFWISWATAPPKSMVITEWMPEREALDSTIAAYLQIGKTTSEYGIRDAWRKRARDPIWMAVRFKRIDEPETAWRSLTTDSLDAVFEMGKYHALTFDDRSRKFERLYWRSHIMQWIAQERRFNQ